MMFRPLRIVLATLAVALPLSAAKANVLISVNESAQRMTVTVDGERRWTWPVSTGRPGFATPTGSFTTFRMEEDHYSKEWNDAPMPHSIFFTKLGHAIHRTMDRRRLGSAASHGCVRLSTSNAAMLYALVKQKGLANTQVVVTAGRPSNAPSVARRAPRPTPEQPESKIGPAPVQATFEQNNTGFGFTQPERPDYLRGGPSLWSR